MSGVWNLRKSSRSGTAATLHPNLAAERVRLLTGPETDPRHAQLLLPTGRTHRWRSLQRRGLTEPLGAQLWHACNRRPGKTPRASPPSGRWG
ncbi:hypothetical protein [Bailinhaonella thermotolerans]|uniref:hypothetical protein n=1 Tax=Bailinhaonella thermotolerans TaxID=1070861 RepID=UPI0011C34F59|nr:hypothetical protein [Bailinhaonella thermotolerans]